MVITLIANYNYGKYICDAIDSALNQTLKNFIVIVDDCSTDKSQEIIINKLSLDLTQELEIFGQKVKLFKSDNALLICLEKNSGPSFARNVGIAATIRNAEYYQILDADDIMYPNKIERLIHEMNERVGVVYADYHIHNIDTNITTEEYKEPFTLHRLMQECIVHSGSLVNANALKSICTQNGYYNNDLRVAEDWDLWLRISKKWQIKHVPEFLTLVKTHQENSTNSVSKEVWNNCWKTVCQNNI